MPRTPKRREESGFILLASILVISLLTIVLVSSMVLIQIEQQSAASHQSQQIAQQNALFGLSQALGQLQEAAGPDQRVTARADILSSTSAIRPSSNGFGQDNPAIDAGQTFWTGVWRNSLNDYSGPYSAPFLYYDTLPNGTTNTSSTGATPNRRALLSSGNVNWLVSWPQTSSPDPTSTLASQSIAESVAVASHMNVTSSGNSNLSGSAVSQVIVPIIPISTQPVIGGSVRQGGFAYWVSDEGIKAKTNIPDPYLASDPSTPAGYLASAAHFIAAQSPAVNQSLTLDASGNSIGAPALFNCPSAIDVRSNSVYAPTLEAMGYADTTSSTSTWLDFQSNGGMYQADFTVESYGVLADNFNGGLRKDLTAALENPLIYQSQFSDSYQGSYNLAKSEPQRKIFSMNALYATTPPLVTSCDVGNSCYLDGMRWDSLFFYYNLYKARMPSPSSSNPGLGPNGIGTQFSSNSIPMIETRFYQESVSGSPSLLLDPILPSIAAYSINVSMQLNQLVAPNLSSTPPTPGQYDLMLSEQPTIVLYNPFNVQLTQPFSSGWSDFVLAANFNSTTSASPQNWNGFQVNSPGTTLLPNTSAAGTASYTCAGSLGGTAFAFFQPISPNNPEPILPGELRGYGPVAYPPSYSQETFGLTYSRCTNVGTWGIPYNGGPLFACFVPWAAGITPNLVSAASASSQQEELSLSPNLQALPTDSIYMVGTSQLISNDTDLAMYNYPAWPRNPYDTSHLYSTDFAQPNFQAISSSGVQSPELLGTVSNLTGAPVLISAFQDRLPGINASITQVNSSGVLNPLTLSAPFFGSGAATMNILNTEINGYYRDYSHTGKLNGLESSFSDIQDANPPGQTLQTYWQCGASGQSGSVGEGGGGASGNGYRQLVIKDLPRGPVISLGQFKNMNCRYFATTNLKQGSTDPQSFNRLFFPFYPLGGSYPAEIPLTVAFASPPGNTLAGTIALIDSNFLANEVLFDSYFLSTVPPAQFDTASDANNWPIPAATFATTAGAQGYINANEPLPNSRLVFYARADNPNSPANSTSPNAADVQCANSAAANLRKPAANLLLNGAFNVNSTSVAAWQALLSSSSGQKQNRVGVYNAGLNNSSQALQVVTFGAGANPFLNFAAPMTTDLPSYAGNAPWTSIVNVKNADVYNLAKNIVSQIQLRGPFMSLGDFLNRRLDASSGLGNSGALQAAIDQSNANAAIETLANGTAPAGVSNCQAPFTTGGPSNYTPFPAGFTQTQAPATPTNSAAGIPGTINQPDLVQAIAPVISDRSDTFTIRAYGETVQPGTSQVSASAWCEAVVQRVPEYLYANEDNVAANGNFSYDDPTPTVANTDGQSGLSLANYAFGRRFKIIAFRWLTKDEI